ncbi:hypothetical protein C2E23DRAFT_82863 [Lenzites betulinus]|nr:hypothetical protein C2E23DRAFT_82863 [Lenzites betulinus]
MIHSTLMQHFRATPIAQTPIYTLNATLARRPITSCGRAEHPSHNTPRRDRDARNQSGPGATIDIREGRQRVKLRRDLILTHARRCVSHILTHDHDVPRRAIHACGVHLVPPEFSPAIVTCWARPGARWPLSLRSRRSPHTLWRVRHAFRRAIGFSGHGTMLGVVRGVPSMSPDVDTPRPRRRHLLAAIHSSRPPTHARAIWEQAAPNWGLCYYGRAITGRTRTVTMGRRAASVSSHIKVSVTVGQR